MPRSNSPDRIEQIVNGIKGRRVLVVGDVMLDRYIWGKVERTSPEAPVPIVRVGEETERLGGAANVVSNLAALGARPDLIGVVGADEDAESVRAKLREMRVAVGGLIRERGRPTTLKTRVMSMGQQLIRLDREETGGISRNTARRLMARFEKALPRAEALILSDYGKGALGSATCRSLIAKARRRKIPIIVDPKGQDYSKYRGATVIKPNQKELQQASGQAIEAPKALEAAGRRMLRDLDIRALIVSRSGLGVSVFEQRRAPVHIPAQARAVYDETGCGDSLIAAMSAALAAGATMAEAARLGNAAGSIVVGKLGAASADAGELLLALQPGRGAHKLRSAAQLRHELGIFRAAGNRVAFTNGCFDLFHLGQIKFLEQARQRGDALVVAINSDRSVRQIKGPPRPVLAAEERASILSALDCVDFVVIFDEPTPEAILRQLRPDVLVKGKGLATADVVGREIVESYGGKVESLPLLGATTTDEMVERIARQSTKSN